MAKELPAPFVEMLRGYGADYAEPLLAALCNTAPAVSVRANTLKGQVPVSGAEPVAWCRQGFYLAERPVFAADPAWHQGLYYVQDASSMAYGAAIERIISDYFGDASALRYLDACAAPGGKTIAALEALPAGSLVVANEYDRHRCNILLENLTKAGAPAVVVSQGDAARYGKLKKAFDIIALDAPCSGEGMMRKDEEAVQQWSQALIDDCAATQRRIIDGLWAALKPGGVLIYSTCTFNRTENEEQLQYIVDEYDAESIALGLDKYAGVRCGIGTSLHCYRFAPGHVRGEGLFIAAVRKPGEHSANPQRKKGSAAKAPGEFVRRHVATAELLGEYADGDRLALRPLAHADFIAELCRVCNILRSGLTVAAAKGRDLVPTHELAMSTLLKADSFARLDLDYAAAMAYLRGESINDVPADLPHGYALACYGGTPLGFVKNIGKRANNLYPDAMRLRLDPRMLPAEAPTPLTTQL